jgi:hypothetical protein
MNTQKANKQYKIIVLPALICYIVLVFLDILLTYLTTPDLAMERNLVGRVMGWKGIFILFSICILSSFFVYYKADKYLSKYFISKHTQRTVSRTRSLFFYGFVILICAFYIHLIGSVFAVLNNTLAFIYVREYNFLNEFATQYVIFYNKCRIIKGNYTYSMFFITKDFLLWIIGICIAVYKVRRLKKIQTISDEMLISD